MCTLVEGDGCLPLDIEERYATRNVIISERETQEWERVCTEINNGIEMSLQMTQDTVAVIRGRNVTFDIRKEKVSNKIIFFFFTIYFLLYKKKNNNNFLGTYWALYTQASC